MIHTAIQNSVENRFCFAVFFCILSSHFSFFNPQKTMAKSKKRKKAKNKQKKQRQHQSASKTNFFKDQVRKLPIEQCYIFDSWQDSKIAIALVIRRHVNGMYSAASFKLDLNCLGVADSFVIINESLNNIEEVYLSTDEMRACDYEELHSAVWQSVRFAESIGLKPGGDFSRAKYFLEPEEAVPLFDVSFGNNGQPVLFPEFIPNVYDVMRKLDRTIGRGNYTIIEKLPVEDFDEDFDEGFDEDFESDIIEDFELRAEIEARLNEPVDDVLFEEFYEVFAKRIGGFDISQLEDDDTSYYQKWVITEILCMAQDKDVDDLMNEDFLRIALTENLPATPFDVNPEQVVPADFSIIEGIAEIEVAEEEKESLHKEVNRIVEHRLFGVKKKFKKLNRILKKYPEATKLREFVFALVNGILVKGMLPKRVLKMFYQDWPDDLQILVIYGTKCLLNEELEEIPQRLKNASSLTDFLPEGETVNFFIFFGLYEFFLYYHLHQGHIDVAYDYFFSLLKMRKKVSGDDDMFYELGFLLAKYKLSKSINGTA